MKLFQLTDIRTRKALPDMFFSSKPYAKRVREELNEAAGDTRFFVSPGPDHRNRKQ